MEHKHWIKLNYEVAGDYLESKKHHNTDVTKKKQMMKINCD